MADSASERQPLDMQRYLAFVLLSFCILMLYNPWGRPPVDPPPGEEAAADEQGDALVADADRPVAEAGAQAEVSPAGADDDAAPIEGEPAAAPQRVALGSVAPNGAYRMLATFTNAGAAVERIELSSPDFRDLDDRSGYLGALAVEPVDGGVRVTVVGPGTPAAEAGLKVGDVITNVDSTSINKGLGKGSWEIGSRDDLVQLLAKSRPKNKISLSVKRGGESTTLSATLTRRPLALIRPESENIRLHRDKLPADYQPATSYRLSLHRVNELDAGDAALVAANQALSQETWAVDAATADEVVFRKRLPELKIEIVKRFRLPQVPDDKQADRAFRGYHLDLDVEVVNLADEPQQIAYTVEGPNGLPIEGWWYSNKVGRGWGRYGIRDVIVHYFGRGVEQFACSEVVNATVAPMGQGASMAFIAVDAQYFAAALLPDKAAPTDVRLSVAETRLATPKLIDKTNSDKADVIYNNPTFTVTTTGAELPARAKMSDAYTLFAGPKRPELLGAYYTAGDANYSLRGISYYGWFSPIAKLMLGILHTFYAVVRNYGVAIVLLTVLVRGCMVPVSMKQARSMAKMQELKPEMDRIAKKHKDNRQKQAEEQQALFRKHNVNPLGGCLPMFIQLPIFIGLYRALSVDIELRQASVFGESIRWCSNLAAPDMLYNWGWMFPQWFNNGQGIFALGPFLNILPIASVVLILWQQKMFMPKATTPEAELQQKLMKYMMGFMGFMFFKFASGLSIYFITTTCWGIVERKMLPKPTANIAPPEKEKPAKKKTSTGSNNTTKKKKPKKRK